MRRISDFLSLLCIIEALLEGNSKRRDDFKILQDVNADRDVSHEIVIATRQLNIETLERIVHQVSDPFSPEYGQYLSREDVGKLTSNRAALDAVKNYLEANDVLDYHQTLYGEYIKASAPRRKWEELFSTKFKAFKHISSETIVFRSSSYTLDSSLVDHVIAVSNLVDLPFFKMNHPIGTPIKNKIAQSPLSSTGPSGFIVPSVLNSYYNIFSNQGNAQTSQTIYSSIYQYFSSLDIAAFQRLFSIPPHPVDHDVNHRNNPLVCSYDPSDCAESDLDLQYILSVAQNVTTSIVYENVTYDFLVQWSVSVANATSHSDVYSISYGEPESYLLGSYTPQLVNTELMKLCAMGVTVVVASGDAGAAGAQSSINGESTDSYYYYRGPTNPSSSCRYDPSFPASSPYVTSVGATMGVESGTPEVACQSDKGGIITSGGGFSNIFPAFPQQKAAINQYLKSVSPKPVLGYNSVGRGFPDVSLAGLNYVVVIGGSLYGVAGTSASAPSVAGMISLINSARKAAGRPTVGWLNPALYASNGSFANDITIGDNLCLVEGQGCCTEGFNTTLGWDPVTGFGSVDFTLLHSLLVSGSGSRAPTKYPSFAPSKPTVSPTSPPTPLPSPALVGIGTGQSQDDARRYITVIIALSILLALSTCCCVAFAIAFCCVFSNSGYFTRREGEGDVAGQMEAGVTPGESPREVAGMISPFHTPDEAQDTRSQQEAGIAPVESEGLGGDETARAHSPDDVDAAIPQGAGIASVESERLGVAELRNLERARTVPSHSLDEEVASLPQEADIAPVESESLGVALAAPVYSPDVAADAAIAQEADTLAPRSGGI